MGGFQRFGRHNFSPQPLPGPRRIGSSERENQTGSSVEAGRPLAQHGTGPVSPRQHCFAQTSSMFPFLTLFVSPSSSFFCNLRKFFYVKCTCRNQYVSSRKTRSPLQDWYVSLPVPPVEFCRNHYTYTLLQGSQVSFLARAKTYCSYLEMDGVKRWQIP